MTALKVGLTGGLAAGKSSVARGLAAAGFTVVDADRLVAELYRPGEPGASAVALLFGADALDTKGAVDHQRLAEKVFADPGALDDLERAIHPLVRSRFEQICRETGGVVILEATLLVEAGFASDFDLVVTVEAPDEVRLERAVARGLSPEDAEARLGAQGGGEARRAAAHIVLVNDGSREELQRKIDRLAGELRRRLEGGA